MMQSCSGPACTLPTALRSLAGRGDAAASSPTRKRLALLHGTIPALCMQSNPAKGVMSPSIDLFWGASIWPPSSVSSKPSLQAREGKSEMQPAVAHGSPRALHSWVLGAAGITPCPAHCRQPSHLSLDGKHIGFAAARCRSFSSQSFSREMVSSGQTCKPPIKKKTPQTIHRTAFLPHTDEEDTDVSPLSPACWMRWRAHI